METTKSAQCTDLSYLKQLSNGSNEFIYEMISVFIEQTPKEIDSLENHLKNKDWASLRKVAHKMKASFSFMGIKELETVIRSTEEYAANETNLDLLPDMVDKIKSISMQAVQELEAEKQTFAP
jgi:HPt (histidine-containing phosphotransfer) domain-containing protein